MAKAPPCTAFWCLQLNDVDFLLWADPKGNSRLCRKSEWGSLPLSELLFHALCMLRKASLRAKSGGVSLSPQNSEMQEILLNPWVLISEEISRNRSLFMFYFDPDQGYARYQQSNHKIHTVKYSLAELTAFKEQNISSSHNSSFCTCCSCDLCTKIQNVPHSRWIPAQFCCLKLIKKSSTVAGCCRKV